MSIHPTISHGCYTVGFALFRLSILCLFLGLFSSDAPSLTAATVTPIYAIQGSGTESPLYQQWVDTYGVVTGVVADGFYLQDPLGDGDPATSDGIYVYTREAPTVQAGQCIQLQRAYVDEFYEKTELSRLKAILPSIKCAVLAVEPVRLPHPRLGHEPEVQFERFEGMVVEFEPLTAVVQGPTKHFADGEAELALLAETLLPYVEHGRVFQSDTAAMNGLLYLTNILGATLPEARQGDVIQIGEVQDGQLHADKISGEKVEEVGQPRNVQAIIDYNFGKYQLHLWPTTTLTRAQSVAKRAEPEFAAPVDDGAFTVCTYNLHGMGRGSAQYWEPQEYDRQLAKRARTIAESLRGCTIIGLQEAGYPEDVERLAALLHSGFNLDYDAVALPGPGTLSNEFPLTNGLLTRRDQVVMHSAALHQGCSPDDYQVEQADSDCVIGQFPLFNRPPLLVDMAVLGSWGEPFLLSLIVNHWKSKGGDETVNVVRRTAQAAHVATLVQEKLAIDPLANVIVLGDLNDYYRSGPIEIVRTATYPSLIHSYDYLSPLDQYSYIFNGGSQVLDHMLVTPNLTTRIGHVDPVHLNADFPSSDNEQVALLQRSSDHDPVVMQIQPAGIGIVGGNLGYADITVTLAMTTTFGEQVAIAQAVTDHLGDFRFWSVPPGDYYLRIDTPAYFSESGQPFILSVQAGYQIIPPVAVTHKVIEHAAAAIFVAPMFVHGMQ